MDTRRASSTTFRTSPDCAALWPRELSQIGITTWFDTIVDSAIDLAVNATGRGTLVNYQFDTTDVNVVVDYYKSALVSAGWQDGPSADIVANDSATLVRVNDAGDIITVGIVRDPATGNVDVQVDVTRASE